MTIAMKAEPMKSPATQTPLLLRDINKKDYSFTKNTSSKITATQRPKRRFPIRRRPSRHLEHMNESTAMQERLERRHRNEDYRDEAKIDEDHRETTP